MLELNARGFLRAVTELRDLLNILNNIADRTKPVADHERASILAPHVERLITALSQVGARSALASANRLKAVVADQTTPITYEGVRNTLFDVESRFIDHLADIKLFVLNESEANLMGQADTLLSLGQHNVTGFSSAYPAASFEIEEAAKCMALGRYTASVFHCMRALEVSIKALATFLKIPDPTKQARSQLSDKLLEESRQTLAARAEEMGAFDRRLAEATLSRGAIETKLNQIEAALAERDGQISELEEARAMLTERNAELVRAVGTRESAYNRAQEKIQAQDDLVEMLEGQIRATRETAGLQIEDLKAQLQREQLDRSMAEGALEAGRKDIARLFRELSALHHPALQEAAPTARIQNAA